MARRKKTDPKLVAIMQKCQRPRTLLPGVTLHLRGQHEKGFDFWTAHVQLPDGTPVKTLDLASLTRRDWATGEDDIPTLPPAVVKAEERRESQAFQDAPVPLYHATHADAVDSIMENGLGTDRPGQVFATTSPKTARRAAYLAQGPGFDKVIEIDPDCLRGAEVRHEAVVTRTRLHQRLFRGFREAVADCDPDGALVAADRDLGLSQDLRLAEGNLAYYAEDAARHGYMKESRVIVTERIPRRCLKLVPKD